MHQTDLESSQCFLYANSTTSSFIPHRLEDGSVDQRPVTNITLLVTHSTEWRRVGEGEEGREVQTQDQPSNKQKGKLGEISFEWGDI